ncbi:MAG: hypothetical protein M1827_003705 [Pycnora praestabilis]|nr:MAG: hypothetical protein M1827_003705 [Pycnora praestabilis]
MTNEGGVIISPHPPPVEFPYPSASASSSAASATSSTNPLPDGKPQPNNESHSVPTGAPIHNGESNPTQAVDFAGVAYRRSTVNKKFLTERPKATQRTSILKRRVTGGGSAQTNELNTAAWNPNSTAVSSDSESLDSSSSGSDSEPETHNARAKPNSRAGAKGNKAKNLPGKGRRGSSTGPFSRFSVGNDQFKTKGKVSKTSGRLNISVNETLNSGYLAKALGATLKHFGQGPEGEDEPLSSLREEDDRTRPGFSRATTATVASTTASDLDRFPRPTLNIVIMVIGSRGDIQPFLKIGKLLKEEHGHRVRIATHPAFKKFVEKDSGLEFFSVGGDPAELMAFMVKNPGLIPSVQTVRAGDIGRRRDQMFEMFQGFWRACINATDDEKDLPNLKMMADKHPFVADAIIANPPSFAHVHCAERLGIPLHLMFTFPYSPTQAFPHPLANIKKSNVDTNYTNFMSYPLVEMMTWQGLGDLVNRFRVKTLGLEPVSTLWAPGQLFRLKVPYTYLWSPGLVPKPADWGPEIDIAGFVYLDLASSFKPPQSLTDFLDDGPPPVYIGFGSIVVDDPDKFTKTIFKAVEKAGCRALVSKGWGGLGEEGNTPDNVYMLENTPHDWLFPRVSAVIHHGGAGTSAAGLKFGKPTMIVPFFGDQPFWGSMVAKAGAGYHEPVPYKDLTVDKLAEGIHECLSPEAKENAEQLARDIAEEGDGAQNAVKSFHRSLPLRGEHSMRCSILEDRVAVWNLKRNPTIRLSALAADILVEQKRITWKDLRLLRHYEWNDFDGPGEPLTGGGAAIVSSMAGVGKGIAGMPIRWAKTLKRHERHVEKKKRHNENAARRSESNAGIVDGPEREEPFTNGNRSDGKIAPASNQTKSQSNGTSNDANHADTDSESMLSEDPEENIVHDIAADTGKGLTKSGEALAKAPMDLSMAIAQGFHNAPRLYGDSTVRRPIRVSGMHSGLKAAGAEFYLGIYDGWTGLVVHPYNGACDEGALGFVKGVGKGFGGFVLKDIAAIIGPFGYTLKGIHKEIQKSRQPTAFIRKARIIQGEKDIRALAPNERVGAYDAVSRAWRIVLDLRTEVEATKSQGLRGRIELAREKRKWHQHGAFENVNQADKALRARKKGISIENVFGKRHDDELKKAQGPRKSTMTEKQKRGGGEKGRGVDREEMSRREEKARLGGLGVDMDGNADVDMDAGGTRGVRGFSKLNSLADANVKMMSH